MKLINIFTNEIVVFGEGVVDLNKIGCKNVAEMLAAGWEDYKEPKGIQGFTTQGEDIVIRMSSIEEAEKAVEKLKAWKRLKDKGFKFTGWDLLEYVGYNKFDYSPQIGFSIPTLDKDEPYGYPEETEKDLDLLFGGEE